MPKVKQKELWEKLAQENSKYYVNSDYGKGITEEQFVSSGLEDYNRLIIDDKLFDSRESILDLGCGTGRMTEFMARDFKLVIGTDISGEMIRQARERLEEFDNIQLYETDGYTLPLQNDSVDNVLSYLVFQHMKSKEMVESNFKEVYRVLKRMGLFKVRLRIDNPDNMDKWWNGVGFDEFEIDELCMNAGFTIIKEEQVGDYGVWLWLEK